MFVKNHLIFKFSKKSYLFLVSFLRRRFLVCSQFWKTFNILMFATQFWYPFSLKISWNAETWFTWHRSRWNDLFSSQLFMQIWILNLILIPKFTKMTNFLLTIFDLNRGLFLLWLTFYFLDASCLCSAGSLKALKKLPKVCFYW